ncbi:MAG TPA: helix-turn-helix transcriptional regulator [Selenomonadales bacterium]|nr:helix-turn-helix transcriptional regulator [Selenomonadales bacterium]
MLKSIVDALRNERIRRGQTMKDLSRLSGVSVKQICNIENGKVEPTLGTLQKIERSLGIEIDIRVIALDHHSALAKTRRDASC